MALERRVAVPVAPADSLAAAAPAARNTRTNESMRWILPIVVLVALLGLFVASRFAYWRWAIQRSRRLAPTSFDPAPGMRAPSKRYILYRGTKRWGK